MKGKNLAVGAALIAVPSLALAAPAAADRSNSDISNSDVPVFSYQGTPVSCNLLGSSAYHWDEESDRTTITGSTQFRGASGTSTANHTRCQEVVVVSVTATVHWLDGDNKLHGTEGVASVSDFVSTSGFAPGNVNEVNGNHSVQYFCDGTDGLRICSHSVATSPATK